MTTSWPPRSSDRAALIQAYESTLGWPLTINGGLVSSAEALAELERHPALLLRTDCRQFDAVVVPYSRGMSGLLFLDRGRDRDRRSLRVPAIVHGQNVTFLVQKGTGEQLSTGRPTVPDLQICSGPDQWLTLPPTGGARWDTPPWEQRHPAGLSLRPAEDLRSPLS